MKMPEVKTHLKHLYRSQSDVISRAKYLRLDMNENVAGLPKDFVKGVLNEVTPEFLATYPEYKNLQEKIAVHNNLRSENICLSNGSDAAIKYIFDAYVSSGDRVLFAIPTFAMYQIYCNMFDAVPVTVEYKSDLSFPANDFIDKISSDIKIAIIVNPNNPTGSAIGDSEFIKIIKKGAANDVLLIVDEAYFYFYPKTVIGQLKSYKNLIVLRTFSKFFAMASVRLGYAASCAAVIENLKRVKPTYDINGLAALFGERVLDNYSIIQNFVKETADGKKFLIERLFEEKIEYKAGCGNFILIKCGHGKADRLIKELVAKHILVSGGFKYDFLKDYIRVTIGSRVYMEKFWCIFINIWKGLHGR